MKKKPNRSRRYINYGAIPANEFKSDTIDQTPETPVSDMEDSGPEQELNADQERVKLPGKVRPRQQFRQDRTGKQKPSGTSLGWRTNRKSQRNKGSDNNR